MVKKVISIILYVISGFFLLETCILMFMTFYKLPIFTIVFTLLFVFILAFIPLIIGLVLTHFQNWKRDIGIIMTSVAGSAIFFIFTITMLLIDPKFKEYMPEDSSMAELSFNYISGISYLVIFSTIGILLIVISKRKSK